MKPARTSTELASVVRYRVDALLRGSDPGQRSRTDTRDLVHLVRYMATGSGIRIVYHTTGVSARVDVWLDVFGQGASALTWEDLEYACALSLALKPREVTLPPAWDESIAHAFELERIKTSPLFTPSQEDLATQPEWLTESKTSESMAFAQPTPSLDAAGELLRALSRSDKETWVVTTLMSADALDQGLLLDEIHAVIGRGSRAEYSGAVVCARTIVASASPISPAILAGLAKRSPELEAVAISPKEAIGVWNDPAHALAGHAVAESHAIALARVPAAGNGKGLGISSRLPSATIRALDPALPKPRKPIRLGVATDIAGSTVDVALDAQDFRRHMFVEGKSGAGKSALLKNIAISWLETGYPLVVLDPHGDVAQAVAGHCALYTDRDTHYIRHWDDEHPIGLNPLAADSRETLSRNVDALLEHMQQVIDPTREGYFGERAKRMFWLAAEAGSQLFGRQVTIQIVQTLLLKQDYVAKLARAVRPLNGDLADRLVSEFVELPRHEWAELVSWYQSRFQMWQRTPALQRATGLGIDAVDMDAVLNGGVNLVVDLASPELGDPVAGLLGGIYLRKLRDAMGRRINRDTPVLIVFDEAHMFRDEAPDRLLAEGRKFGMALVIASQSADNLTPQLARAIEANVGSFISLRTGLNAAPAASLRLGGWPANELTRLPDLTAATSLSSNGVPTDAFTLTVDYYSKLDADGWTADSLATAAESVAQSTLQQLWYPHREMRLLTDSEVLDQVTSSIRLHGASSGEPEES